MRSLAKVTNVSQADSAGKTRLLKGAGVKPIEVEPKQKPEEWAKRNSEQKSNFKQDFSRIPVSAASTPVVQPKLVVGRPGDRYEQEADRIAEQVMQMPNPITGSGNSLSGQVQPLSIQKLKSDNSKKLQRQEEEVEEATEEETVQAKFLSSLPIQSLNSPFGGKVQRQADELQEAKADDQEEEEPVQAKFLSSLPIQPLALSSKNRLQRQADELQEASPEDEEEPVQTKSIPHRTPNVTSDLSSRLKASKGGGQPLPASTREFMESRFNHDFSRVRVHTDGQANQLARDLKAQAFTFKQDIYFGTGYYQPHSSSGKRLLAHELTHTIQQQPQSFLKPRSPVQFLSPSHQSRALSEPETDGTAHTAIDSTPEAVLPIAQTVPEGHGLISRRVAPPSAARPVPVADEKKEADPELEGPFAPPSAKTAEPTPTASLSKAAPKTEEASEETSEKEPAEPAAAETASTGSAAGGATGAKAPTSPEQDPAFQSVVHKAKGVAKQQKHHASAKSESGKAQAAAEPPKNEVESKAQDRQVQELDQQKPGTFNADTFVAELLKKIEKVTPENEEQAKEFKKNNKIDSVKKDVSSQVTDEKQKTTDPIAKKNKEAPNTSGIEPKPVKPLEKPDVGPQPPDLNAAQAAPKPKPEAEVSEPFKQNSKEIDQQMSGANVTEEQLAKSNEPEFTGALEAKKTAQTDAAAAPDAYRKDEQGVLTNAQTQAQAAEQTQTKAMFGQRGQLLAQVQDQQKGTKDKDEQERAQVANHINGIYEQAKKDVEEKLKALDDEVNKRFDAGAQVAKEEFTNYVDKEMDAYKEKRYGAWYDVSGYGTRIADVFTGLPPKVNEIFVAGRAKYIESMQATLKNIANYVADTLNQAKQRIADGKKEIQTYVAGLKPSLQKVGQEAADKIQEKFDQLEEQVNSKQDELIDSLVEKYQENLKAIDEDIKKRQDDNKGWIDKAKDKIQGVLETIRKLREMLEKTLARIAEVAQLIINDPIGFLKNLVAGLKQGFQNFVGNIGKHLQAGFITWLTGTLGPTGIQISDDVFSLKGIFSLVMQILGLSWAFIREKAVKLLGEPIVAGLEKGAEIFQILIKEGPVGLWNYVKEQFANLKETVMDQIKDMVITQVIQAGVKWILGLLNPVAAFIKAAIAIYDIVMFFVERAAQILEFINSVVDAVAAIAKGQLSSAAKLVENALAKSIPLIIGLLAALLGVSGIAKKVQAIIQKIRQKIDKAIEGLILKIKKSKIFQTISKKVKGLIKKGKAAIKKAKKKAKAFAKKVKKKVKAFGKKAKKKVKALGEKLIQWWKAKKNFKGKDGKNHQLFLKGSKTSATLMLASQPETYLDFIKGLKIEKGNTEALDAKINGKAKAEEIDKESKRKLVGATEDEKKADSKKKKDAIDKLLTELAPSVAILLGIKPEELPKSVVVYQATLRNGSVFALRTEAKILSREGEPGSEPKDTNPVYEDLFLRKEGNRSYYVRGHMLNENIHGPGVFKNLTPLSQTGNKNHLEAAEKSIKIAVLSGAVVRYTIAAKYAYSVSVPSDDELQKAGVDKAEWENVKKVRKAENNVPKGLTLGADLLKRNTQGEWVKDKALVSGQSTANPVDTKLDSYKTVKGPVAQEVGLKTSSIDELVAKTGIQRDLLEVIQNAAKSVPGTIFNINQIVNVLPKASGYIDAKDKLYRGAINKISSIKREEVNLN